MPAKKGAVYTVGFAAAVCLICGVLVSSLSVALKPMQEQNQAVDKKRNVLIAAGRDGAAMSDDQVIAAFEESVRQETTEDGKPLYEIMKGDDLEMVVLPVEGKGLWSTLYGFLALDADGDTIRGIAFYKHGETPGLGGEIENPRWQALWDGRKAYDSAGRPVIAVIKGKAGDTSSDPHHVDGLSGATLTSNGVTALVQRWLGEDGYGPFLAKLRKGGE